MATIFVVGRSWAEDRFPTCDDIVQVRLENSGSELTMALYGLWDEDSDTGEPVEMVKPRIFVGDTVIIDQSLPCWIIGMLPSMFDLSVCLWDGFTGDVHPL